MRKRANGRTDVELMLAVASGHVLSAGPLFERHHERLYRYFYSIFRNRADSMDAVQDVFDRLIRYGHSFRGGSFLPWVFRIARNVAIDRQKGTLVPTSDDLDGVHADTASRPDHRIETGEEKNVLAQALELLSPRHREVLVLSRYADLSYREIGSVLNCSAGAAKVRAHRALVSLRENYLQLTESEL